MSLADIAGLSDDQALVVLHPRGLPTTGGLSRGWWTDPWIEQPDAFRASLRAWLRR